MIYNKTSLIKKEDKEKLFHRFYRGDNSRSRTSGGSGLGLAIAQQIALNNKWEISIKIIEAESIEFIVKF